MFLLDLRDSGISPGSLRAQYIWLISASWILLVCGKASTKPTNRWEKEVYTPVIKHGALESTLFSSVIFLLKPQFLSGFSNCHVWWNRRLSLQGAVVLSCDAWYIRLSAFRRPRLAIRNQTGHKESLGVGSDRILSSKTASLLINIRSCSLESHRILIQM